MQTANVTATELLPVSPPNSTQSRQTRYIYYMDKAYEFYFDFAQKRRIDRVITIFS